LSPYLLPQARPRTGAQRGAAAALVAMGAGAPGIEGLSSGTKRIEEARTNSMGGLTSGERRRRRPELKVNRRRLDLGSRGGGTGFRRRAAQAAAGRRPRAGGGAARAQLP
jgi:hypothetical protein